MASDNPKTPEERVSSEGVNLYVDGVWIGRVNYIEFVDTAKERLIAALESMRTDTVKEFFRAVRKACPDCDSTGVRKMADEDGCPFDAECTCTRMIASIRKSTGVTR